MQKKNMGKFKNILIKCKDFLLDLLYPNDIKCLFCETDVPDFENNPICEHCQKSGVENTGTRCMFCDVQILNDNKVCDFCASKHKYFEKAVCPFVYQPQVRHAILALKNDHALYLVPKLARMIYDRIIEESIQFDYLVPVPVTSKTRKRRGYNQSEELAKEISRLSCKPVAADLLIKFKETKSQKFLGYEDRQKNLAGSITLSDKNFVKGKSFLIVDDVITTCATVNLCAKLLKEGKAKKINVAAIARNPLKNKK